MKNNILNTLFLLFSSILCSTIHAQDQFNTDKREIILLSIEQGNMLTNYRKNAQFHLNSGHYRKAHKLIIKALEIDKKQFANTHQQTASDLTLLATILFRQDHYTRAKTFYLKSQEIRKKLFSANNVILTDNLFGLAQIEKAEEKYKTALLNHKLILKKLKDSKKNNHINFVRSLLETAHIQIILANFSEAETTVHQAEELINEQFPSDQPLHIALLEQKSLLSTSKGNFTAAENIDKIVLEKKVNLLGRNNVLVANSLSNIARRMMKNKSAALAIPLLKEAQAIYRNEFGSNSLKYAANLSELASANLETGAYVQADKMTTQSTSIIKKILFDTQHSLIAFNLVNKAKYLSKKQNYNTADQHFIDAQMIFEKIYRNKHPVVAEIIADRADLFVKKNEFAKAKSLFIEAINILKSQLQENHPLLLTVSKRYNDLLSNKSKLRL